MINIIRQIQASITCEARWLRWVWRKCKRKAKYTIYTTKAPTPPQTKPYGWQTPIPPSRKLVNREESRDLVKMLANCLSVSIYLISMSPFSTWSLIKWCLLSTCLIFLWKIGFLATEMALVLSHMRRTLSNVTPKSLIVCTIQRICEQQLHTRPQWWTVQLKTISEKTSKREKIQKMASPRSALSVNPTTRKISIRKANKIQWRRNIIPNPKRRSMFEILENPLNCHLMWRAWGSLKARALPHDELNVRPCRCKV
jgi:hypothetical protein